jgi:integrase/recombinase XerD
MPRAITRATGGTELVASEDWSDDDRLLVRLWLNSVAQSSAKVYDFDAHAFGRWASWKPLRTVTLDDLQRYAHHLGQPQPPADGGKPVRLKDATIVKKLAALKSLFTFGAKNGYLPYNVGSALRLPKRPDQLAERILDEQVIARVIAGEPLPLRRLLCRLFYYSGGRIAEVIALKWEECHAHKDSGVITFSQAKGGRVRTVKLPGPVWSDLIAFKPPGGKGFVFASDRRDDQPVNRATAWRWVKAAGRRVGVEMSPHWFRHAHASHALDQGAGVHVVQATLGHASLATTSRYVHARPDQSSGDYLKLDGGDRGRGRQLELGLVNDDDAADAARDAGPGRAHRRPTAANRPPAKIARRPGR